jgi:tetratricopeptide (TPR) repeat protein
VSVLQKKISKSDHLRCSQAHDLWQNGELDGALKIYDELVEKYSDSEEFIVNRGVLIKETGDIKRAEKELRAATCLYPRNERASFFLYFLLARQDRFDEAFEEASRFASLVGGKKIREPLFTFLEYLEKKPRAFTKAEKRKYRKRISDILDIIDRKQ